MPIPLLFQGKFTEKIFQEALPFQNSISALKWVIPELVTLNAQPTIYG